VVAPGDRLGCLGWHGRVAQLEVTGQRREEDLGVHAIAVELVHPLVGATGAGRFVSERDRPLPVTSLLGDVAVTASHAPADGKPAVLGSTTPALRAVGKADHDRYPVPIVGVDRAAPQVR